MDYTIAFILPNTLAYESTKQTLKELDLEYPAYKSSSKDAVVISEELLLKGTRMIVTAGITYDYLEKNSPIALFKLPFSGLEAAIALKKALAISNKIVHVGTQALHHYLEKSAEFLGLPKDLVHFYDLDSFRSIEEQTSDVISQGYEVVIGGYVAVNHAKKEGVAGIEVNVDNLVIRSSILNAQSIVSGIIENENKKELYKAILNSTSEGLVVLDSNDIVFTSNRTAINIFDSSLNGYNIYEVMKNNKIINIDNATVEQLDESSEYTAIVANVSPVFIRGKQKYTVMTIRRYSDIQKIQRTRTSTLVAQGFYGEHTFNDIKGSSKAITLIKEQAKTYAKYDSAILIHGETGTGKELFAQSIHNASRRKAHPFVPVNCASLPDNLIESELFGYEKGAFTGANKEGKKGFFELADGGTIFLDEISEIPISTQSKLLRVIEEGDVIRIGSDHIRVVNTRVICSSNKDLLQLIKEKKFKEDLYYRLCVLEINLPPLRERKEDIKDLSLSLLERFNKRHNKNITTITPEGLSFLESLPLLGNIRELANIIERVIILAECTVIDDNLLKSTLKPTYSNIANTSVSTTVNTINLKSIQNELIISTLAQNNGNKAATARALGIDPSTLWRKIKKYGIIE